MDCKGRYASEGPPSTASPTCNTCGTLLLLVMNQGPQFTAKRGETVEETPGYVIGSYMHINYSMT